MKTYHLLGLLFIASSSIASPLAVDLSAKIDTSATMYQDSSIHTPAPSFHHQFNVQATLTVNEGVQVTSTNTDTMHCDYVFSDDEYPAPPPTNCRIACSVNATFTLGTLKVKTTNEAGVAIEKQTVLTASASTLQDGACEASVPSLAGAKIYVKDGSSLNFAYGPAGQTLRFSTLAFSLPALLTSVGTNQYQLNGVTAPMVKPIASFWSYTEFSNPAESRDWGTSGPIDLQ